MRICRPGLPPIDDDPNAPPYVKPRPQPKQLLPGSTPPARPSTRDPASLTKPSGSISTSPPGASSPPSGTSATSLPSEKELMAEAQRAAQVMAAQERERRGTPVVPGSTKGPQNRPQPAPGNVTIPPRPPKSPPTGAQTT